jgi:hypothetical protein
MRTSLLSKEGLQVLELLPVWHLKAAAEDPQQHARGAQGIDLLTLVPVLTPETTALLQQIRRAMGGLHLPPDVLSPTVMIQKNEKEKLFSELNRLDPRCILVFGESLAKLLSEVDSIGQGSHCSVVATHDLGQLIQQPELKAQVWRDLCSLTHQLIGETSLPG